MTPVNIAQFSLNIPQARALTAMPKEMWILAGRGSGKTTGVTAPWAKHKVDVMPRSSGAIVGQSFNDIETKILEPLFEGWLMMGLEKDVHFVYGKRPPDHWKKSYVAVTNYDHWICFPNGSNIELISLHLAGSANGKSRHWLFGPEIKFFNPTRLRQEVFPILRGWKKHFAGCPWGGAKLFETDKFGPNIEWLLEKRKLHNEQIISAIIFFQLQMNELAIEIGNCSKSHSYKLLEKYKAIEARVSKLRSTAVYVGEFSALDNIMNLGESYFFDRKQDLSDYEYRIAILNEDPTKAEKGFYPDRKEEHLYRKAEDDDVLKPLGIALDYQASISPLVSCQINDRVIPGQMTLNFLDSMYVKQPQGLDDVIDLFCLKHRHRPCKVVYYYHDQTAIGDRNQHKCYRDEVKKRFEDNGWRVVLMYTGAAPNHDLKYNFIKKYLQNKEPVPYMIRFNQENCAALLLSMDMSGTKETEKGTRKDKDKEKDKDFPQEKTTHFSDVFDMLVDGILVKGKYPISEYSEGEVVFNG